MSNKKLVLLLLLLAAKAYATVTVTINVSNITGGNLPGSSIVIALQNCTTARIVGTGQIVPQSQTVYPHFGASTITLFDNTQISCSGQIVSYYSFSFIYQGVTTQIGSYNLPPGTYQLANLTPCTGTACYGPAPAATPVTQIVAGSNIAISPTTGVGVVTVSSTGGTGLSSFTVGNLSPIFTAALGGSPLTAPALAFTLSGTSQNFFLAGPTGGSGVPAYRALVAGDVPTLNQSTTGNAATATLAANSSAVGGVALSGLCQTGGTGCPAAGSGNTTSTSLTTNIIPKANGANSIINSGLSDDGTKLTYTGSGTANGFQNPEGTAIAGLAASDNLWSDSTTHRWMQNPNNTGALMIPGVATAATANHLVSFGSNGIDLVDGGSTPLFKQYTYVVDSTAATVTSPAITVAANDLVVVSCRFSVGSTGTATDSASDTFHALTAQINGASGNQMSWAIIATTGSTTFTCTQSSSAAGISIIALDYSGTGTTANTSAGATSLTTPVFSTTQRTLDIQCASTGLNSFSPGIISGGYGVVRAVSQSGVSATNPDQGCQDFITPSATPNANATISTSAGVSPASTVLAFNY